MPCQTALNCEQSLTKIQCTSTPDDNYTYEDSLQPIKNSGRRLLYKLTQTNQTINHMMIPMNPLFQSKFAGA